MLLPTDTQIIDLYTLRGAEKHEDESDSVVQPLLQHKHPDSCVEKHKADMKTATAGADRNTSVSQELELAVRDQPDCCESVSSRHCRVPHLQRAVRLAWGSPLHLAHLPPHTVPLCSWHHEANCSASSVDRPPRGPSGRSEGCRRSRLRGWTGIHHQSWP